MPGQEQRQAAQAGAATRIDAIWAAPPSDDSASRFLDALLAEGLLCPVWSREDRDVAGTPGRDAAEADGDAFSPLTVERDGAETFCLFDTVERLEASDLEATEYVAAPGSLFFQLAAEAGAQIAFNPGVAESESLFSVETVSMVADLVAAAQEEELVGDGQSVEILPPEPPSETMLAALSARLAAAQGAGAPIAEAWLVAIHRGAAGGVGRSGTTLALGLAPGAESETADLGSLARELSRLGGLLLSGDDSEPRSLDVALLAADERALVAARKVGLGLLGAEPE